MYYFILSNISLTNTHALLLFLSCHFTVPVGTPTNISVTVESSRSIMLTWERPSIEEENGLLVRYHVIVIETQIHYTDDGAEITGMQTYLNITYDVSEGRAQLIDSLHPDYNYTVRIAAATEPGIGPFSDATTVRTDMDGELLSYYHSLMLFYIKLLMVLLVSHFARK